VRSNRNGKDEKKDKMKPKKPKGFKAFDDLARKLVQVPKSELSTPKPKKKPKK
jgi:hypothetical protein